MSFIKKTVPPPEIKEGEILTAKILGVTYPIEGKYEKQQIKWRFQLANGFEAFAWMSYYEEPSDKSALGLLCITYMNTQQQPFGKVSDVIEAIRNFGKLYVKCTGFREWNDQLYPKFKILTTKLPTTQPPTTPTELVPPTQPQTRPIPIG